MNTPNPITEIRVCTCGYYTGRLACHKCGAVGATRAPSRPVFTCRVCGREHDGIAFTDHCGNARCGG